MSLINPDTHVGGHQILLQPHPTIHAPKQDDGQVPPPIQVKSNGEAHAAQQKVIDTLKKDFNVRDIQRGEVLTGAGMKDIIGSASRYAKVKDTMMRVAHRIFNRLKPDAGIGSNHKAAIRLARQYENLKNNGAPDNELRDTLTQLKEKLNTMHHTRSVDAEIRTGEALETSPMKALMGFIDQEIATLPSSHLEKADALNKRLKELMNKDLGAPDKIVCLKDMIDHLKGADPEGTNTEIQAKLKEAEDHLALLTTNRSVNSQVRSFAFDAKNTGKGLKHVRTDVQDPMNAIRFEAHQEKVMQDPLRALDQMLVNIDISKFDRSQLKHVETNERTGLEQAQRSYTVDSLIDDLQGDEPTDVTLGSVKPLREPSLDEISGICDDVEFRVIGSELSRAMDGGNEGSVDRIARDLGTLLAREFSELGQDRQLALATSDGEKLKDMLLIQLKNHDGSNPELFGDTYKKSSPEMQAFLDKAFAIAATNLSDRQVDANTLILDGVTYTKGRELGRGGFAIVWEYTGVRDGEPVNIAVKEPINPDPNRPLPPQEFAIAAQEARTHFLATGTGSENMVGFRGAIRTPEGNMLVAMDIAPGGSVHSIGLKLDQAVKDGLITPQAANVVRMTLLKDMALGLRDLQELRGMTHFDLKPVNYFIGEDGRARLGDFGIAKTTSTTVFFEQINDNSEYGSPEAIKTVFQLTKGKEFTAEILKAMGRLEKADQAQDFGQLTTLLEGVEKDLAGFKELYGGVGKYGVDYESFETQIKDLKDLANVPEDQRDTAEISKRCKELFGEMRPVFQRNRDLLKATNPTFRVTTKTDTWSLGVSAFELFTAEPFFPPGWARQVEGSLTDFARDPENNRFDNVDLRLKGVKTPGVTGGSESGAGALTRLLNQLLHPDPEQRPTITDALKSTLFDEPGVGSDEARNLIKLLGDSNATPEQIKKASTDIGV